MLFRSAYNEGKVDIHAIISVVANDLDENGNIVKKLIKETSVGRVIALLSFLFIFTS